MSAVTIAISTQSITFNRSDLTLARLSLFGVFFAMLDVLAGFRADSLPPVDPDHEYHGEKKSERNQNPCKFAQM